MSNFTKRYLITIVLLSVTALVTFGAYSTRSNSDMLYTQDIPMIIGGWYGRDLPMDDKTYDILETRDIFSREYVNSRNEKVIFTVVFSQNNRKITHPPEVCFAGGGWSRTDRDTRTVRAGSRAVKANRLILQKGADKQVVLYLYKAGGKFTSNYYVQQLNIILNGMLRKNVSSALIRISSYTTGSDVDKALAQTEEFAGEIIPIIEEYLP